MIQSTDDPLIPVAAGRDIAAHLTHSWLLEIAGMGHDLPPPLFDILTNAIAANARRTTVP